MAKLVEKLRKRLPNSGTKFDVNFFAVVEAAAESILITTSDLDSPGPSIVYVNPSFERMTGWSREEILGKSPRILQGPNTNLQIFADLKETLRRNGFWEGEAINYRKDGSEFWMEWSISPLKNEPGELYQFVAIQRDVSARKLAELRLHKAQIAERVAEREKTNLARYFSPKIVEVLAAKDRPLDEVRRQNLAVLFADIKGFTRLSESLDPEQVIQILRDIHIWAEQVIFKWDGVIEGYIGDSILAIFGFPESGDRDASNGLACAYDLLTASQRWNKSRIKNGLCPIHIGVGINYGSVVLGDVGTKEHVEFTVIGDTVNTTSRLQQATRALHCDLVVGQSLVNEVIEEIGGKAAFRLLDRLRPGGNLSIRGRSQRIAISTYSMLPD